MVALTLTLNVPQTGFAQAAKQQPGKPPNEMHVATAMIRYRAALRKHGGEISVSSFGDAVSFGVKHVHNRGRELGDHRSGEFKTVIRFAVIRLLTLGRKKSSDGCIFDRAGGSLRLVTMPPQSQRRPQRRPHTGKRPEGRRRR